MDFEILINLGIILFLELKVVVKTFVYNDQFYSSYIAGKKVCLALYPLLDYFVWKNLKSCSN